MTRTMSASSRENQTRINREYWHRHPERNEIKREQKRARKRAAVDLFGGRCQRCDYAESMGALQFHHVDENAKDITPSWVLQRGKAEDVLAELDKCVLLCANCHAALHAGDWQAVFIKRDGLGWTVQRTV